MRITPHKPSLNQTKQLAREMSSPNGTPIEGVVQDADVLDTELQDIKLEVPGENQQDAIFRESQSNRRTRLLFISLVFACLTALVATFSTLIASSARRSASLSPPDTSGKHEMDHSDKHPNGDLDRAMDAYVCLASTLTCNARNFTKLNYTEGGWLQAGNDVTGEGEGDLSGRSVALSCDGQILAVGAPRNGNNTGHARVYTIDQATHVWTQIGSDIDGIDENDQAGTAVALSADGRRVALGAALHDGSGDNAGHVRVLEYDGKQWSLLGQEIFGEGVGDQSGKSISLSNSGHRLAVGGSGNNATGEDSGHARVYEYNAGAREWEQIGADIDGKAAGDYFGKAVALSGDGHRVAIGGHKSDGNHFLQDVGHVRFHFIFHLLNWWLLT